MTDEQGDLELTCEGCEKKTVHKHLITNIAMPEYLYIRSNNYDSEKKRKNRNPIAVPEELDLTEYMVRGEGKNRIEDHLPVHYGLRHIIYHSGDNATSGHYTASVTGMPPVGGNRQIAHVKEFFCNDANVYNFTADEMD
jgi:uncharacterized UBP type Zn finger protein